MEKKKILLVDDEPDLVLLDVMMPKLDGLKVCRKLKKDLEFKLGN